MNIRLSLSGVTPLLQHNPRMVDPEFALNREIKALTTKKKKTDEDLQQIERLEWYGGLYEQGGIVVEPTAKVRKCLVNTARIQKLGKGIERTLSFTTMFVPLVYDGPKDVDELFRDGRFHSRLSVGIRGKRVMRVRPKFVPWAMEVEGIFITDAGVNFDELQSIVDLAGQVEGIGDNRVNGYGRFTAKLEQI